jgi:hypothetical protein
MWLQESIREAFSEYQVRTALWRPCTATIVRLTGMEKWLLGQSDVQPSQNTSGAMYMMLRPLSKGSFPVYLAES